MPAADLGRFWGVGAGGMPKYWVDSPCVGRWDAERPERVGE